MSPLQIACLAILGALGMLGVVSAAILMLTDFDWRENLMVWGISCVLAAVVLGATGYLG